MQSASHQIDAVPSTYTDADQASLQEAIKFHDGYKQKEESKRRSGIVGGYGRGDRRWRDMAAQSGGGGDGYGGYGGDGDYGGDGGGGGGGDCSGDGGGGGVDCGGGVTTNCGGGGGE